MFLTAILSLVSFAAVALCSDVIDLNKSNFDEKLKDVDVCLVEFYAPWCGHCKALAPKYEEAATKLKADNVCLSKVDCDAEKDLCSKYGVQGFPTLKIFKHGEVAKEYDGPRDTDGIVKYMLGQAGPSSKELTTVEEIEKFLARDEYVIVGCFEKETKLKETFLKVADVERDNYRFAHSSADPILKKLKCKDDIIVYQPKKLHNKFEKSEAKYDGDVDKEKIKKFLKTTTLGLCGIREPSNSDRFEKPLVVVYYDVDYVKNPKGTGYWRNRVLKVAEKYVGKVNFAISSNSSLSHEMEEHGLGDKKSTTDKPLVAAQGSQGQKFFMQDEFSPENLEKFVKDLIADKLEAHFKSEPIPEKNDEPVKVVVARTFNDIVNDNSKDVLIEFYAPWCGHCKQLAPKYDELATKLKDEPSIVIAKMDATANDVPPTYDVKGFPTIFFVPKSSKDSPIKYEGGREVKDFIKYLATHSTHELIGYDRSGKKVKKDGEKSKKDEKEEL